MALQIPYFINYYQSKEYFTLRDKKISEFILSTTTSSDFILTDYSRFSFLTKRPTPPSLTDLSYGISHHVEINADFIIKKLKKFNIPLVIIQTEGPTALHLKNIPDFPKLQKYLRENYFYYGNLTNGREVFEIYLKNSRILFNSSSLK
ncbi:MAG: hypothetical protein DRI36_01575 [Caldiserica bacterium]|nr:MAG: hypothetical protein DRI36_01575 [Caldisericota bacterium]